MPRPRPKEVCHGRSLPVRKRSAFRLRAAWMHRMRGALLFRVRVPARVHPLLRPLCREPARAALGAIGARADLSAEEDMESKGTIFRQLLRDEPYLYTGGIYSPLDAQIAESAGMKSIYLSGYSVAMLNGWPDMGLLTMTEVVKTGVAGIHLEDQRFPKRCGHIAGKTVVSREEAIGKYRAALAERDRLDRDFVVIARTDAYGAVGGSMEEAIWRGRAYADAGVDLVWCELSNSDRGPAIEFARAMKHTHPKLPLAFNYSSSFRWHKDPHPLTFRELGELGYKFIFITLFGAHAAMYSVWNAMHELVKNEEQAQWALERTKVGHPTESHHVMARVAHFQELERKYIPGTEDRLKESDGFGDVKAP